MLKDWICFFALCQFPLPVIMSKSELAEQGDGGDEFPHECVSDFWTVEKMYDFENVGFSMAFGNIKYLICADCEIGPIGYHDVGVVDRFHIATCRITDSLSKAAKSQPITTLNPHMEAHLSAMLASQQQQTQSS